VGDRLEFYVLKRSRGNSRNVVAGAPFDLFYGAGRLERVNELLQRIHVLHPSKQLRFGESTPGDRFASRLLAVDTTADLMEAKVFYSVMGTEAERARAAEQLDKMRWELTRSMRRLESLNRIPHFHFIFDDTPSRAARVHDLIEKAHQRYRTAASTSV
jgi:ribosome-binding factor A